jgi:hypothetical protein
VTEIIDFALEGSSKASLAKALRALGNQLGYDLIDPVDNTPRLGVDIVVFVPPGANTSAIPEGYHLIGPFPHKRGVYDEFGVEIEAPVLGANWFLDVRLSPPASDLDRDGDGVDEITKSTLKTWMKNTGVETVRASLNPDFPPTVTYYEKALAGGDWVRLYWNLIAHKHEFFGGRQI